ncbi:protein TPR2 [Tanacetum coccineum]|uniref:Protein TPR2 n=1 Tax=Tanacetum coccineum TaxID=301880 RepID=A0ABQ5I9U7_9ASTR
MAVNEKLLLYHVHQLLRENNLVQTLRSLEIESGIYLDVSHVEHLIQNGEWDQLHKYIYGFFSYGDDRTTMEISFQIKKQKFFEALKRGDHAEAVAILFEKGNTFRHVYQKRLNELLLLTIAEDPWNDKLSDGYNDEVTSRDRLCAWIKDTFQNHSGLREKMKFPNVKDSVLSVVSKHRPLSVEAESALLSASSSGYTFPIQGLPKETVCHGAVNPVRCLRWTSDGLYLGVGFKKHVFQLLSFEVTAGFQIKIEIEAHRGSVNDIAYYTRNHSLYIVTCGEDGFVKIWNEKNNQQPLVTLKGHATSVKSISYSRFLFSTDISGKMKIWEVDVPGKEVDFNLQGCLFKNVLSNWRNGASCLFTSEEDKDFLPSITEWRIDDKSTSLTCKRRYKGVGKIPHHQFTFDTNGKILVVGNEQCLKFWDVDCDDCLWTTPSSDELQDASIIRLSRNGLFLAVLALDKSVKILGNLGGLKIAFANESAPGKPGMPQSIAAQYVSSARALGVDNVRGTAQPVMPTSSVPSLSIDRSTDVGLRGHPQMLTSSAVPQLLTADASRRTGMLIANTASTPQALMLRMLASQVASSSSSKDKHESA